MLFPSLCCFPVLVENNWIILPVAALIPTPFFNFPEEKIVPVSVSV